MASRRTTHRSSAGKKLYAVRDAEGQFKDIQTFQRAHAQDLRQKSSEELAADAVTATAGKKKARKKAAKKANKKAAAKAARTPAKKAHKKVQKKAKKAARKA